MFIPIQIDFGDLANEFSLSQKDVNSMLDSVIKSVTARFYEEWIKTAKQDLGASKDQYARSLVIVDEGFLKGSVVLTGVLPNMIESGTAAFDMKEGLLSSPKAKLSKDGKSRYITIPFRHASSDAGGFSEIFSTVLPKPIQQAIQQKQKDSGNSKVALRKNDIPAQYAIPQVRGEFSDIVNKSKSQFDAYIHKSSIYEGLTRKVDTQTGMGTYMTFRRVSDKSDANAFIHSGILARNLAEKTYSRFEGQISKEIDISIDNFLNSI